MKDYVWKVTDECLVEAIGEVTCTNEQMSNFYVGGYVTINVNGKDVTRKVYDNRDFGLIVRYRGYVIAYSDFN